PAVLVVERAGLVEEAQVRPFHVEAHRGDPPLVLPGWSRKHRSGPFTLKHTAAIRPLCPGECWKTDASRNSTALVFVASPETPERFRCAASGPSRKSASR